MKNRNLDHKDDWATPRSFYKELDTEFHFNFDPCPYNHDVQEWDGLLVDWKERNFVNPPYSRRGKEAFVKKAVEESRRGKLCVMLLPVSTSTALFHDYVQPNATEIRFLRRRLKFIGINTKGEYVNWDGWKPNPPEGASKVSNSGMHDSMIVVFDGRNK